MTLHQLETSKNCYFFVCIVRFVSTEKYRLYSTKKGQIGQALKKLKLLSYTGAKTPLHQVIH